MKNFILIDHYGNARKTPAGLNYLEEWEFAQSLTTENGKPKLFKVTGEDNQWLVLVTLGGKQHKTLIGKITSSQHYEPLFTEKVSNMIRPLIKEPEVIEAKVLGVIDAQENPFSLDSMKFI